MPAQKRKPVQDEDEALKEKRRLQWKINQRNSRQKRNDLTSTLSKQIELATLENQRLEQHLHNLATNAMVVREPTSMFLGNAAVRIIDEYYQVFKDGFASCPIQQQFQYEFVRKIMTSDTSFMNAQGAESVVNQWRLMTTNHHSLRIQPLSCEYMKEDDGVVVRAVSRYILRISRKTVENLYPHLLNRESLVQTLIGLEVAAVDTVHSCFDLDGRIIRHDVSIDLVNPLIKLLGDVQLAAEILNGSHLADNGLVDINRSEGRVVEICPSECATESTSMPDKPLRPASNDLSKLLST